jgi:iron complex transport system substrate-binding protein
MTLRLTACLAAALLAGAAVTSAAMAAQADRAPRRVMSMNLCSDQMILGLLPPERIASVTWNSRRPSNSFFAAKAALVPVNYGLAEEVLAQRPDLVVAGTVSTPATRQIVRRANIPLLELDFAENDFDDIRATTRLVARAVGAVAKGEELIRRMNATLAELAATAPPRPITVAMWSGDRVPGRGTLPDTMLTLAGGTNIAVIVPDAQFRTFDIEELLQAKPAVLAFGDSTVEKPGFERDRVQHPAVRRIYADRQISFPSALYGCGVPESAEAIRALRQELFRVAAVAGAFP